MPTKKKKPKKIRARRKSPKKRVRVKKKASTAAASPPASEVVETTETNGHSETDASWNGERVLSIRKRLGMTQEQFATKLGVAFVTVNRWENDKFSPRGLSLEALRRIEEGGLAAESALPKPNPFLRNRSQSAHA